MRTDTQADIVDQARRTLRDPDAERSLTTLSGKLSPGTCSSQTLQIQDSSAKLPLAPSHRLDKNSPTFMVFYHSASNLRNRNLYTTALFCKLTAACQASVIWRPHKTKTQDLSDPDFLKSQNHQNPMCLSPL